MMKKFLSLLSVNAIMLPVVSFTIACKKGDPFDASIKWEKIFDSEIKTIKIGVDASIFSSDEQKFEFNKKLDDYYKNLQLTALSALNKTEKTCFLNTSFIKVTLYRENNVNDTNALIKDNDDLKKTDIDEGKIIYVGFSTIVQNSENKSNNFKNLLRLELVKYDNGLLNMEKTPQQPYCGSKNHEV